MDSNIEARISPTFSPENFAEGSEERGVAKAIHDAIVKYEEAVAAIRADRTLTDDARDVQELQLREALVGKVAPKIDSITRTLAGREESLLKSLEERATHFGSSHTITPWEVRSAICELPESERLAFIRQLARDGDREAIAAIGNRPWALGLKMPAGEWRAFRLDLFRTLEPEVAKRIEATQSAGTRMHQIATAFAQKYGFKPSDNKASAARVAAEKRREAVAAARS